MVCLRTDNWNDPLSHFFFSVRSCWEISPRYDMLNTRGQNCLHHSSPLDLFYSEFMKRGSGSSGGGGGGSALHPLSVCQEAPQAQQANEGLIPLWTASRSGGWSPWHGHTEQDEQTLCPHYILYSCTVLAEERWSRKSSLDCSQGPAGVWRDVMVPHDWCRRSRVAPPDRDSPVGSTGSNMEVHLFAYSCSLAS